MSGGLLTFVSCAAALFALVAWLRGVDWGRIVMGALTVALILLPIVLAARSYQ